MDYNKLQEETADYLCKLMKQQSHNASPPEKSSKVFAEAIVFAIKRYEEMKD